MNDGVSPARHRSFRLRCRHSDACANLLREFQHSLGHGKITWPRGDDDEIAWADRRGADVSANMDFQSKVHQAHAESAQHKPLAPHAITIDRASLENLIGERFG